MSYDFSNKIKNVKPSIIREILKQMSDPSLISFAGGNPAPESFPAQQIINFSNQLLQNDYVGCLQYSLTEGYTPLRQAAKEYINAENSDTVKPTDDLIITSGSQQIIDFMARVFCNEQDYIVCEDITFLGALNSFKSYGCNIVGIGNDATNSIDLVKFEQILQSENKPKFFYTIPNFQNPTGLTMPIEKRKAVYNLCEKYNVLILEDNPYGNLRYKGEDLPPIKSFDEKGLVVYAYSLSKIMCPGFRVAFCLANSEVIQKFVIAKQCCDVHSNIWAQRICYEILTNTDMKQHIKSLQQIYKAKAELMIAQMQQHFSSKISFTIPDGGMFIWVTMPNNTDVTSFINKALEQKVAVVPGSAFMADETATCNCFRMNFSTASEQNIIKGVEILGKLTKEFCD